MLHIISHLSTSCGLIFLSDFSDWRIVHSSSLLDGYYFVFTHVSTMFCCFVTSLREYLKFDDLLNPYLIYKNWNRNQPNIATRNFLIPINS